MIKKIFLTFYLCGIFILMPELVNAKSITFDARVGQFVAQKYFEHMKTNPTNMSGFPIPEQWTDKHIFLNVLRQWKYCLEESPDHSVSTDCVIDKLCAGAFNHIPRQNVDESVIKNAAMYCDRYGTALIETEPAWSNPNCDYNIYKIGYWQEDVRYEKKSDKHGFTHEGGSIAWRFNNPGNLRDGEGSRNACAWIPVRQKKSKGKFAVYTSLEAGREAQAKLLKTKNYRNKTIDKAIERYAPKEDGNNPVEYANNIKRALSARWPDKKTYYETVLIKDLTDEEFEVMKEAMAAQEKYTPGHKEIF